MVQDVKGHVIDTALRKEKRQGEDFSFRLKNKKVNVYFSGAENLVLKIPTTVCYLVTR